MAAPARPEARLQRCRHRESSHPFCQCPIRRACWVLVALTVSSAMFAQGDGDSISLLLQNPLAYDAPADRCAPPICTQLVRWIEEAESQIDFAIYGARHQTRVLNALLDAQGRGVRVRGYVDRDIRGHNYYASTDEWATRLGGIESDRERERLASEEGSTASVFRPRCARPAGFAGPLQCLAYDLGHAWLLAEHASRESFIDSETGSVNKIMHHKFFVIDDTRVWTGSANLSDAGTGGYHANAVLAVQSARVAALYSAEFEGLRARAAHQDTSEASKLGQLIGVADGKVNVLFTPRHDPVESGVRPLLASARETIDVAVFFLTHKQVVADLIAAHQRGVRIRIIVDATSAKNGYTKHELLRSAGVPTKIENWGGKMHAKAAAIDGQFLIAGSMNWTSAGQGVNDENTLLVRSERLAAEFTAWFDGLWESIPDAWRAKHARPDPESQDSGSACFDGVDNDFDQLVDEDDPGCGHMRAAMPSLPPHRLIKKDDERPPRTHTLHTAKAMCSPTNSNPLLVASGRCPERASEPEVFRCGTKRTCAEMASCAEARFFLSECELSRLDGNDNGVPCEALCG